MRRRVAGLAVAASGALVLGTLSPASADDPAPSADEVRTAEQRAQDKADQVGAIKARLVEANQRVETLALEAGKAAEKYNGLRYKLSRAKKEARRTARREKSAAEGVEKQRRHVESLALQGVQQGTGLNRMSSLFETAGPAQILEQTSAYESTSDAVQAALAEYASTRSVYKLLSAKSEKAVAKKRDLADQAAEAKEAADEAVAASEDAASNIAGQKKQLVDELARAEGISSDLAQERQDALERRAERRKQRAAQQAAAEAAAEQEQQEQAAAQQEQAGEGSSDGHRGGNGNGNGGGDSGDSGDSGGNGGGDSGGNGGGSGDGGGAPSPSGGADAAIAFARAQIGEPYVWAADGPDSWDCSGLTMKAWARGGEYLPHYSAAQYDASTPVGLGEIQPGDLLFWSDGGPSSIYHVALYVGDGMMIHAPRPGRGVEEVSMYYWITPDLAARP